jgi:hypothetical protein
MIAGLRELAVYLAVNTAVPVCTHARAQLAYYPWGTDAAQRAEVDRLAGVLGVEPSNHGNGQRRAARTFGPVELLIVAIDDSRRRRYS